MDILTLFQRLEKEKVEFISLKENMDPSMPIGKAMLQMMSVIAELERNLLDERVKEGITASKKRGVTIGRPKIPQEKLNSAMRMYDSGDYSIKEILESTTISQGTLYREINKMKLKK